MAEWIEGIQGIVQAFGWTKTKESECPGEVGDVIEFQRGSYSHWAINIGNNEVVHLIGDAWGSFTSATIGTNLPKVRRESYADVNQDAKSGKGKKLDGSVVRVNNTSSDLLPAALPPQAIVERALSQVGEEGYHLLFNNCEHFVTWSRHSKGHSKQTLAFLQANTIWRNQSRSRQTIGIPQKCTQTHLGGCHDRPEVAFN